MHETLASGNTMPEKIQILKLNIHEGTNWGWSVRCFIDHIAL